VSGHAFTSVYPWVMEAPGNLRRIASTLRAALLVLICHFSAGRDLFAQQSLRAHSFTQQWVTQNSSEDKATEPPVAPATLRGDEEHLFFDRENIWLFAGVGASRTLDYFSTLNMRHRGRQEILLSNWIVDHHALFAGVEVGGTALSIGASYLLHRTGHHRLERAFSMVHVGLATTGAVRNYSLKTAHIGSPDRN
jgi:hypothetical protein